MVSRCRVGIWCAFVGAAALTLSPSAQEPAAATIVGTVVDAACFMMHPQAAGGPSHDECGKACALAGVPLGVVDATGKVLYLTDATGSKQLLPHLHRRVQVRGRAVKKAEPLTLQMPVGPHNTMTVRVDGGYMALALEEVEPVR